MLPSVPSTLPTVFGPTAHTLPVEKCAQCPIKGAGSARHRVTCTWATSLLLPLSCCPPPPPDLRSLERPRFCLLSKEEGRSFGFHLQQELGRARHVVCRVEPGTSAQRQGLREGDRILGVNNHVVEHEDSEVVRLGWDSLWYRKMSHTIAGREKPGSLPWVYGDRTQASTCLTSQDLEVPRSK